METVITVWDYADDHMTVRDGRGSDGNRDGTGAVLLFQGGFVVTFTLFFFFFQFRSLSLVS